MGKIIHKRNRIMHNVYFILSWRSQQRSTRLSKHDYGEQLLIIIRKLDKTNNMQLRKGFGWRYKQRSLYPGVLSMEMKKPVFQNFF